jgi:hypothetical protein
LFLHTYLSFRSVHLIMIGIFVRHLMILKRLDGGIMMMLFNIVMIISLSLNVYLFCTNANRYKSIILISWRKTNGSIIFMYSFFFYCIGLLLNEYLYNIFSCKKNICVILIVHHTMLHKPFLFKIGIERMITISQLNIMGIFNNDLLRKRDSGKI